MGVVSPADIVGSQTHVVASGLSLSLPCTGQAPQLARLAVSNLSGIEAIRDDALLVVSELVANAVVHSGSVAGDSIALRVRSERDSLTISVRDAGRSDDAPHMRSDGDRGRGGFGLVLVDQLARRWDSHDHDGRVVWAEMSVPHASGAEVAAALTP